MRRKKVTLTERDLSLLEFVWKWKVVSTAALTVRFFGDRAPETAYTRLWRLRRGGFLTFLATGDAEAFVWSLTQKGFHAIRGRLPELEEVGFKSESISHDHLVTSLHLGEWLREIPAGTELASEQEIRRLHVDCLPSWCPATKSHRPDGYIRVSNGDRWLTIALEVELNQKRSSYYSWLAKFYDERHEISRVVWIVRPRTLADSICRNLKKTVGERAAIHNLVSIGDFRKYGWQAPILFGSEQGKPLGFLLRGGVQTSSNLDWTRFLLDTRKCPHKSKSYGKQTTSGFGNCMRLYPHKGDL